MRFPIPKIIKPLRLAEYELAYGDAVIAVWVNPQQETIDEYMGFLKRALEVQAALNTEDPDTKQAAVDELEQIAAKIRQWVAMIWSQDADAETHWSEADIEQLYQDTARSDPQLWPWLTGQTLSMVFDYRRNRKKVSRRAS